MLPYSLSRLWDKHKTKLNGIEHLHIWQTILTWKVEILLVIKQYAEYPSQIFSPSETCFVKYFWIRMYTIQKWSPKLLPLESRRCKLDVRLSNWLGCSAYIVSLQEVLIIFMFRSSIILNERGYRTLPTCSSIFICFCKQQQWLTKINQVIYFSQSQLLLAKTNENQTTSRQALYRGALLHSPGWQKK